MFEIVLNSDQVKCRLLFLYPVTVEVRNPQIQNKQSSESEQRWRPWTPRYMQI